MDKHARRVRAAVGLLVAGISLSPLASAGETRHQSTVEQFNRLPLNFEANTGQLDPAVAFAARGAGYSLLLTAEGPQLQLQYTLADGAKLAAGKPPALQATTLRTRLVGGNREAKISGESLSASTSNYLSGSQASAWHTGVPHYGRVRYSAVYPGIDLVYHGDQQQMEYDFVVAPHGDPSVIALRFDGGAGAPRVDADGNLVINTAGGDLIQHKPVVYQQIDGQRRKVDGAYRVRNEQVGFALGAYDRAHELVIDPLLGYKLYVPGINVLQATSIAVSADGSAYIGGYAPALPYARNLPLLGGVVQSVIKYEAFVAKLNPAGNTMLYTTFIGGSQDDEVTAIAVDGSGNVVLAGYTRSNEFPLVSPLQGTKGGYSDAFVAKLAADGKSLLYSTYLGGNSEDAATALALDAQGNILLAGNTASENFPVTSSFGSAFKGGQDVFVAKIAADGSSLLYSGLLGGGSEDDAAGIAVDSSGNAYVTGSTNSQDFPTLNAFQSTLTPYVYSSTYTYYYGEVFLTKINTAGSALVYSTYLGGSQYDAASSVAVDAAGSAYITGITQSDDFPVANALRPAKNGYQDAFVTKFSPAGDALVYSTFLGGNSQEFGSDIKLDASGAAYITGYTYSQNFPVASALQSFNGGGEDIFISKLAADGQSLQYSTFFGAGGNEAGARLVLGDDGSVYVTGNTTSRNFPVKDPVQGGSFGAGDAYALKLSANAQTLLYSTYMGETNIYLNYSLTGYTGTSPSDPALNLAIPFRGLIGCTLRALPTDIIGDLSVLYKNRIPCGSAPPPP
ncbi:MAG: Beta-propeller repeat-containing protein [Hydrocarboniphaga sp.]|uniref:DUF7948 domain-containing protein n=1 Tax=Hydrocarboniphaga sp. TaxID=2033016 RepID=UPI002619C276|nr:SBBP repeat-containing protein [Hydrocarboniphaga sp.]MDB5969652.1 Beta-propeller repeat-containing protein [Hydrocarboniphaga sp.]